MSSTSGSISAEKFLCTGSSFSSRAHSPSTSSRLSSSGPEGRKGWLRVRRSSARPHVSLRNAAGWWKIHRHRYTEEPVCNAFWRTSVCFIYQNFRRIGAKVDWGRLRLKSGLLSYPKLEHSSEKAHCINLWAGQMARLTDCSHGLCTPSCATEAF